MVDPQRSTTRLVLALSLVASCNTARSSGPAEPPRTLTIAIEGMTCGGCVNTITAALQRLPGVQQAKVALQEKRAVVVFAPAQLEVRKLLEAITKLGYKARALPPTPSSAPSAS